MLESNLKKEKADVKDVENVVRDVLI